MDQRKNNIFMNDIEIPDIVQQKADLAFSQIREEKVNNMNQNIVEIRSKKNKKGNYFRKAVAAAAACAVLATAVGVGDFYLKSKQPAEETVGGEENSSVMNNNPFVLRVQAAGLDGNDIRELESGIPVTVDVNANGWVMCGSEDGTTSYCINLPFSCEGENIDRITYSINKGSFQIVEKEDAGIVLEGKEIAAIPNAGQIGGSYDEENDGEAEYPVSVNYYTDFTIDYEKQSSDTTWINMCNEVRLSDFDLIWGENRTMEDLKKGYQELIDGVVITCTVHFEDGTSKATELEVGTVLTTAKEAGFENETDPDAEDVFFTFERK